jgi:hypothetical protein
MSIASRLNGLLLWTADRFVLGTLTCLLCLGVVTAPAALAAGAAANRGDSLRSTVPQLLREFRAHLRPGLKIGASAVILLASAVVSLLWITTARGPVESVVASAAGLQTSLAAIVTLGFGAAALDMGVTPSPRNILVLLVASPGAFVCLTALAVTGVAFGTLVAPILIFPFMGVATQIIAGIGMRFHRRLQMAESNLAR